MYIKKQLEENQRAMSILNAAPTQKFLRFNSVCFLEAKVMAPEKVLIHLEGDYLAETSLGCAKEIIKRKMDRYRTSLDKLKEQEAIEKMERELQGAYEKQNEGKKESQQQVEQKVPNRELESEKLTQTATRNEGQNQSDQPQQEIKGTVTEIADQIFEIKEELDGSEKLEIYESDEITPEQERLMQLMSDAFLANKDNDFLRYQAELKAVTEKVNKLRKKPEKKLMQQQEDFEVTQAEEQEEKRVSKFKQERMKNNKNK